jgi:outer membrane receptor protein involved in Fe transport
MKTLPWFGSHFWRRGLGGGILGLCGAGAGLGQVLPPAAPVRDEPVVELSPFVVDVSRDQGYVAVNTMSGSRLNTPLALTPASISEFTPEFLADIGANNVLDAVEYSMGFAEDVSSTNGNPQQGNDINLSARGVPRATGSARPVARNYFVWYINGDSYNTERLSFSRGPNSILFGLGDPGGIINTATKQARFRTFSEVELKADDNGSWRVGLDHNRQLGKNLALRLNLLREDRRTWREIEYYDQTRVHLAATWKLAERTRLRGDFEWGEADRLAGRSWSARDRFTPWVAAGSPAYNRVTAGNVYPPGTVAINTNPFLVFDSSSNSFMNWQRFARSQPAGGGPRKLQDPSIVPWEAVISGPVATSDNSFWTYSLHLEQELAKGLAVELAYNEQTEKRDVLTPMVHSDIAISVDPNVTLPNGQLNPNFGRYYIEGQAQRGPSEKVIENARVSLTYEFTPGPKWAGRHRWVGVAADELVEGESGRFFEANLTPLNPAQRNLSNTANAIRRRTYLDFNGGQRYFDQNPFAAHPAVPINSNGVAGTVTPGFFQDRDRPSREQVRSYLVAGQSYFLRDDRLAFTYGFRTDTLEQQSFVEKIDPVTGVIISGELGPVNSFSGDTLTYGAVFRVVRNLSAYANFSENFSPQSGLDINLTNVGNVEAEGQDYGLKVPLFDGRLFANLGYYQTSSLNRESNPFNYTAPINQIWEAIDGRVGGPRETFSGIRDSQDFAVSGYEFEVVANLARGLSVVANYALIEGAVENLNPRTRGYVEANRALWQQNASLTVPSTGETVAAVLARIDNLIRNDKGQEGKEAEGNRRHTVNIFVKNQFQSGALKPWNIGFGFRYRGPNVTGFGANNDVWYGNSYWLADAMIGYRRMLSWGGRKVDLNLQLNVSNLFDEDELIITEQDTATTVSDYVFQKPRTFVLSARFKF